MKTSEFVNEIASALAKAQGAIAGAEKNATNPHLKKDYADLASVMEAVRAPFLAHGLSYTQCLDTPDGGGIVLVTRLSHSSGQWYESRVPVIPTKNDPQGLGTALTYMRRYSLAAIAGVAQVDDDAESQKIPSGDMGLKEKEPEKRVNKQTSRYAIPFGKIKGKTFDELNETEISDLIGWFEKMNEDPKGQAAECLKNLEDFVGRKIR